MSHSTAITSAPDLIPVRVAPHPFRDCFVDRLVTADKTVLEILEQNGLAAVPVICNVHVFIDDMIVERCDWRTIRPLPGQIVTIKVAPGGGDKPILRTIAMIGVLALSLAVPPLLGANAFTGALLTAGIGIVGSLSVNALIPPAAPDLGLRGATGASSYAITGVRNRADFYGPVGRLFGKHKIYPKLAALPWTEVVGSDQYIRMLFSVGQGVYRMSDYKIGETAITSYSDYWIQTGYKADITGIFPNDIYETALSVEILNSGGWYQQTTQTNTEDISVDITFPNGLFIIDDDDGRIRGGPDTTIEVEYSDTGAGIWSAFPDSPLTV